MNVFPARVFFGVKPAFARMFSGVDVPNLRPKMLFAG